MGLTGEPGTPPLGFSGNALKHQVPTTTREVATVQRAYRTLMRLQLEGQNEGPTTPGKLEHGDPTNHAFWNPSRLGPLNQDVGSWFLLLLTATIISTTAISMIVGVCVVSWGPYRA